MNERGTAALLTVCLTFSVPTIAQSPPREPALQFNLPAQPLSEALIQLATQSGLRIVFDSRSTAGIQAPPVSGPHTPESALELLLANTELRYRYSDGRTVEVRSTRTSRDANSRTTTSDPAPSRKARVAQRNTTRATSLIELDQILVTGSHIRAGGPATSTLITITREQIEKSGFTTLQHFLRSLPQVFNGGPSEDTRLGSEALNNSSQATGINLRGLGAGSTLVLIDGRRLVAGGSEGRFVDVSAIPLAAIERIDLLPDGGSALYGSDAVGGVVNFITRKHYAGAETRLDLGTVTDGNTRERSVSQLLGAQTTRGGTFLAAEYTERDNLPAAHRAQTTSSDLRPFGGNNFDLATGSNPGTLRVGTEHWALPANQDGTNIDPSTLVAGTFNLGNRNLARDVLPETRRWSLLSRAHRQLGERTRVFVDLLYAQRDTRTLSRNFDQTLPVTIVNPFYVNPTGGTGTVNVHYNFTDDFGPLISNSAVDTLSTAAGAHVHLGRAWRLTASLGYASEQQENTQRHRINTAALTAALENPNPLTAFNPFGDGSHTNPATLAAIARDDTLLTRDTSARSAHLLADGVLVSFGGREVKLAIGAEYRRDILDSFSRVGAAVLVDRELHRNIRALFAEFLVPLRDRLDLTLAGRHERFSDFGTSRTPRVGLRWLPHESLTFRGTWGRSFKAPHLVDLDESANISEIASLTDTVASTGTSTALLWGGSNADLQEERADTWTAGLEWTPPRLPGLALRISYFATHFENRIAEVPFTFLVDPTVALLVNRSPTTAQRERICNHSTFSGSADACLNAPIDLIIDLRTNNLAVTETTGTDIIAEYRVDTPIGAFDLGLNATRILRFEQAALTTLPPVDLLDTASNPQKFRARASIGWSRSTLAVHTAINHAGRYRDTSSVPARPIESWTTVDFQLSADLGTRGPEWEWLRDSQLALSVQNVFDEMPPFYNNPVGVAYDRENADVLGRFASLTLRKIW